MNKEQAVHRRVLHRETRSSRTGAAVVLASVLIVLLVTAVTLSVWWLVDPGSRDVVAAQAAVVSSIAGDDGTLLAAGCVAVVLAVVLIAVALLPGRLARRARSTDRLALLVDDGVLADTVADAVAARCGVDPRQVSATVSRGSVTIRVTPTSGVDVDRAAATDSAVAALAAVGFPVAPKLFVAREGVVA
ncbi:hypothetical protein ACQEVI_22300 [Promicromonospora sp. CA-289599]|uniref:hypothetical protein n=1 Tax=Promicromonospora sp. CA-289599 TaxID=3240014 RepID=UPI003D9099CA